MTNFNIDLGLWSGIFAVPNVVVDKHIKIATSLQIKTLLYILRHSGEEISVEEISKALSKHTEDISDSLQYWIELGIIKQSHEGDKNLNTENNFSIFSPEISKTPEKKAQHPVKLRMPSRPQKPDIAFLAKRLKESEEIAYLIEESERILARPLSNSDSATLLMLHDTDGLPTDVILMLVQYAFSIDKGNLRYIEKIGIKWAAEEINTLKKAEQKIRSLDDMHKAWKRIVEITGIDYHSPTEKEKKFSNCWINEWHMPVDLIRLAYELCVDNIGKVTFSYINKILDGWYKNGYKSLEEAKNSLNNKKNNKKLKKNSNSENLSSYSIEQFENSSIFEDK